jgi:hypothetical protein
MIGSLSVEDPIRGGAGSREAPALTHPDNRWLEEQGGAGHEGRPDQAPLQAEGPSLIGTALRGRPSVALAEEGAVRKVVWDRGANHSPGPDSVTAFRWSGASKQSSQRPGRR